MKTVLLLLFSCVVSKADNSFYDVICYESVDKGFYFKPVSDIPGRYAVKWCTSANETVTMWTLGLKYYTSLEPEQCNKDFLYSMQSYWHSKFKQTVQVNSNCTNVCFSTTMDAIFSSACYHIYTEQVFESPNGFNYEWTSCDYYHYVRENDTNAVLTLQGLTNMTAQADYESLGEFAVLRWTLRMPASQYEVTMNRNGTDHYYTNDTIHMNCSTVTPQYVECRARAAPRLCYTALFRHTAPWIWMHAKPPKNFTYTFCHTGASTPPLEVTHAQLWWALGGFGGALLLGALALAALGAIRAARAGRFKENILRTWVDDITRRLERPGQPRAAARILLLYARDCAHMERAAAHLAALLHQAAGCEVVDLYSPATVSSWAPAAAPWLRAVLQRADTRVLLLQSPAVALYCARLARDNHGETALQAPLLGARAAWRRPHAADSQLLLALRFLADSAHHEPLPYKKYYVAHVSGLQHDDVVPALTRQRRYALPQAAALLLRDLAPPTPDPANPADPGNPAGEPPLNPAAQHLLRQFTEALEEFREYAAANPEYLLQDLVID